MGERYSYENYFSAADYFRMTGKFIEKLAPLGTPYHYERGDFVHEIAVGDLAVVTEGSFNQRLFSLSGKDLILYRLARGTILGEDVMFVRKKSTLYTQALEYSSLSIVPEAQVRALLAEDSSLYEAVIHSLIRKMNIILFALSDICFNNAEGSIASFIIRQTYIFQQQLSQEGSLSIPGRFTHQEIASRLSLNRVTVSKVLKRFCQEGLLEIKGGYIRVLDLAGLQEYIDPIGVERKMEN